MNPFTKILVVEDDPGSAKLVTYHLRMMGFKNTTEVWTETRLWSI